MKTISEIKFYEFVAALSKPGEDILKSLTPDRCEVLHMAVGVSGEAGELLDAVKKHIFYNKPIDITNVVEELGDIEFFLEGLRQKLDVTREQTIAANISKLSVRYKGTQYSDKSAQERADKSVGCAFNWAEVWLNIAKYVKFELWQGEFHFYIQGFKEGSWIGEQLAAIHFDSDDPKDIEEKRELAKIMVGALNNAVKENKP